MTPTLASDSVISSANQDFCASGGGIGHRLIQSTGTAAKGRGAGWTWSAPDGTSIADVEFKAKFREVGSWVSRFYVITNNSSVVSRRRPHKTPGISTDFRYYSFGTDIFGNATDPNDPYGPLIPPFESPENRPDTFYRHVILKTSCEITTSTACSRNYEAWVFAKEIWIRLRDRIVPTASLSGSAFSRPLLSNESDAQVVLEAGDVGGGVAGWSVENKTTGRSILETGVQPSAETCDYTLIPDPNRRGIAGKEMQPCDGEKFIQVSISPRPGDNKLQLGSNELELCVEDFAGQVTCTTRTIEVRNPPPGNDDLANATDLGTGNTFARSSQANVAATSEPGEPPHVDGFGPSRSVWYRWTAPGRGDLRVEISTSQFDDLLAVYRGDGPASLANLQRIASSDSQSVTVPVREGQTYWIAVDGKNGAEGPFTLSGSLTPAPANDDLANATDLGTGYTFSRSGQANVAATSEPGEPPHVDGFDASRSVWYKWTAPAGSGGDLTVSRSPATGVRLAIYRGTNPVSFGNLQRIASTASTSVVAPVQGGASYWVVADGAAGTFTLSGAFDEIEPPGNDDLANATDLGTGYTFSRSGQTNVAATSEPGEPPHVDGFDASRSVWYKWTAPAGSGGDLTVTLASASFPALLAVYRNPPTADRPQASDLPDARIVSRGPGSAVAPVQGGRTYWIVVDGQNGSEGTFSLSGEFVAKPPPGNDNLADARNLGEANTFSRNYQTNIAATSEPGELPHVDGFDASRSVWYKWRAPAGRGGDLEVSVEEIHDGPFTVDPSLGLVAIYRDSGSSGLSVNNLTRDASAADGEAIARVEGGEDYWIVVDGRGGHEGQFALSGNFTEAPVNDDRADATDLGSGDFGLRNGTNVAAGGRPGEPRHPVNSSAPRSVWYRVSSGERNGTLDVEVSSGDFYPALAVYEANTGSSNPELRRATSGEGVQTAIEGLQVRSQRDLWIMVDGSNGGSGTFTLDGAFTRAQQNDDIDDAVPLEDNPNEDQNRAVVNLGGATSEGEDPPHDTTERWTPGVSGSVWYSWEQQRSGSLELGLSGEAAGEGLDSYLKVYTEQGSGSLIPVPELSGSRGLRSANDIAIRANRKYWIAIYGDNSPENQVTLNWNYLKAPSNDDFAEARLVDMEDLDGGLGGTNVSATIEVDEPSHEGKFATGKPFHSVWYEWEAPAKGDLVLHVRSRSSDDGTGMATLLSVYETEGSGSDPEMPRNGDQIAWADQIGEPTDSRASFEVEAGRTYRIAVDGRQGSTGNFTLSGAFTSICRSEPGTEGCPGVLPRVEIDFDRSGFASRGSRRLGLERLAIEGGKRDEKVKVVCVDRKCRRALDLGRKPDIRGRLEQSVDGKGRATIRLDSAKTGRYLTGKFRVIHFSRPGGPNSNHQGRVQTFRFIPRPVGKPVHTYIRSIGRVRCLPPTSENPNRVVRCRPGR